MKIYVFAIIFFFVLCASFCYADDGSTQQIIEIPQDKIVQKITILDNKVIITSQNHGFAVDEKTLPETFCVTHRSLFDGTLQGIRHQHKPYFAFQGHPEASPGPHDAYDFFKKFITAMRS